MGNGRTAHTQMYDRPGAEELGWLTPLGLAETVDCSPKQILNGHCLVAMESPLPRARRAAFTPVGDRRVALQPTPVLACGAMWLGPSLGPNAFGNALGDSNAAASYRTASIASRGRSVLRSERTPWDVPDESTDDSAAYLLDLSAASAYQLLSYLGMGKQPVYGRAAQMQLFGCCAPAQRRMQYGRSASQEFLADIWVACTQVQLISYEDILWVYLRSSIRRLPQKQISNPHHLGCQAGISIHCQVHSIYQHLKRRIRRRLIAHQVRERAIQEDPERLPAPLRIIGSDRIEPGCRPLLEIRRPRMTLLLGDSSCGGIRPRKRRLMYESCVRPNSLRDLPDPRNACHRRSPCMGQKYRQCWP